MSRSYSPVFAIFREIVAFASQNFDQNFDLSLEFLLNYR